MGSVKDFDAEKLIINTANRLEKMPEFKPPEWATFVKTGVSRERTPTQKNWWWIRAAGVLRKVSLNQGLGVSKVRKMYGGRKNLGHKPEHKFPGSGSVTRKILQQLESAGFVKTEKGKGRIITKKGLAFLYESGKPK